MRKTKLVSQLSLLLIVPVFLSLESLTSYRWYDSVFHADFAVISITALVLILVGVFIRSMQVDRESAQVSSTLAALFGGGGFYIAALVWLVLHALLATDLATMLALIIYTIAGIFLFVHGKLHDNKFVRWSGAILVAMVVARLLLVEVWNMDLEGRIITFVIIGVMLISTAFIRKLNQP